MAKRRMAMIAFVLCICLYMMPFQVQAASTSDTKAPISTDRNCSLTVSYCAGGVAFSELPVKLYKIADVSADYRYTLTAFYEKTNLILNGIRTQGEWNVIRSTLEAYILANAVASDFNVATDAEGKASFGALRTGLYLAVADCVVQDDATYIFDSSLIALPGLGVDGAWQYHVDAVAKSEAIPPSEGDEEIELKVLKLWKGDVEGSARPATVEIEIFRNGVSHQRVILSEDNRWTYSWTAKNDGADWKVVERNVPRGYTMTVEEKETVFVITNTLTTDDPPPPTPPQTGDTLNIMLWVILMLVFGSVLVILGIAGNRRRVS
jgi:hypothetical protein